MRKIKFRAKAIPQDEWIYGHFCFASKAFGLPHDTPSLQQFNVDETQTLSYRQIDPDTVGQFTGLHDKNGKEIYEGDIIDFISPFFRDLKYPSYPAAPVDPRRHYQCVVVWNERDCGFGLVSLKEALLKPCEQQPVGITQISDSYLIGNIHDNPELLKTE